MPRGAAARAAAAARPVAAARPSASPRTSTAPAARCATRAPSRRRRRLRGVARRAREPAVPPRKRRAVPRHARRRPPSRLLRAHRVRPDDFAFGAFAAWAARRPALVVPLNASEARPDDDHGRTREERARRAAVRAMRRSAGGARARGARLRPRPRARPSVARGARRPPSASSPGRLNGGFSGLALPPDVRRAWVLRHWRFPPRNGGGARTCWVGAARRAQTRRRRSTGGFEARPYSFIRCRFLLTPRVTPLSTWYRVCAHGPVRARVLAVVVAPALRRCLAWPRRPRRTPLISGHRRPAPSTGNARAPDWRDQARRPR